MPMPKDYTRQNLQGVSFRDKNLSYANFLESDIRGADFTGSDLTGANFTQVRAGITPMKKVFIFIGALAISAFSGYIAMLAGTIVQGMIASSDKNLKIAGISTLIIVLLFIVYAYWKGGGHAIKTFILPIITVAIIVGLIAYFSGLGTGRGMLYLVLALILTVLMFIVGTIARTTAGALSNILFIIVALFGGFFGKTLGGGIGTVIMAISCALVSKRALSGAKGFDFLRSAACWITSRFGTSFRNSKLTEANFSKSELHNSDFSNADVSTVEWGDSRKMNCIINENWMKGDGRKKQK